MYSKVNSAILEGVESKLITVEADISNGLPMFELVGYLSSELKEAKERVRTALKNQGYDLPPKRITVNLLPASIRKEGSAYDLPIALSILAATGYIAQEMLDDLVAMGELGLNGELYPIRGVLPMILEAQKNKKKRCLIPYENRKEGALVDDIEVFGFKTLEETVQYLNGSIKKVPESGYVYDETENESEPLDFCDVHGQKMAKRAIEIAVSGRHNLLMAGVPGSGKSMLAKRIPWIMPTLTKEEKLEITKIYSVKGLLSNQKYCIQNRPFRSPHHTASPISIAGGGRNPVPGEISLAHLGVLFLDELPEFSAKTLEVMRQPLEERKIQITRNYRSCTFPADFSLIAAMNLCPCGNYPNLKKCNCTPRQIRSYQNKISGAILDRIDIGIYVEPPTLEELDDNNIEETSDQIRKRVERTREIQEKRYKNEEILFNSQLEQKQIQKYCEMTESAKELLREQFVLKGLSIRNYYRIIKVARTIADMEEKELIQQYHVNEAIYMHQNIREKDEQ